MMTCARALPACPAVRRLYSLMCRWPWYQRSVETYADTSHPPPPRSLTKTLRPETRHSAAARLLLSTCCWWQ